MEQKPSTMLIYFLNMAIVISCMHYTYGSAKHMRGKANCPAVLLFGDSILDTGNNNYLPTVGRADFPPYGRDFKGGLCTGRFSNGKVPSDIIAEEVGVKEVVPPYLNPTLETSDLLSGVSFASAGSGYDSLSSKTLHLLSLDDQLNLFREYINKLKSAVGENRTNALISDSLYVISAGTNDITITYYDPILSIRRPQFDISTYTTLLTNSASNFIQKLYKLGARKIWVIGTSPCGCLPSQRTLFGGLLRKCSDNLNQAALLLNNKLQPMLSGLSDKLVGTRIRFLDPYEPMLDLISNSTKYGFEVTDRGCCGTGTIELAVLCSRFDPGTCLDASKYIFWDSFHPTEEAYKIIVTPLVQQASKYFF